MGRRKAFLYANIVILFSLVLFFSRSLFTDRIPTTTDILQVCPFFREPGLPPVIQNRHILNFDPVVQFVPWFHFNTVSLQSGHLPLWNPTEGCGQPHIANMQSAFFFPLNFLMYVLGMKWGLVMMYLLRLYLLGIFIYLYLAYIGTDYRVSIMASVAGMFTGYMTRWLFHDNSSFAFFLPLGLLSIELIARRSVSIKGYLLLCTGFTLAIFSGHPETIFYGTSLVILYALIRTWQECKQHHRVLRTYMKIAASLIIGLLIAGVQLIPFFEYLLHSTAYSVRSIGGEQSFVTPSTFLFSLIPNFFSSWLKVNVRYVVFFGFFPTSTVGYAGITIFMLGIAGILAYRHLNRKLMLAYIIILFFIIAVSFDIPLLHNLISVLPLFGMGQGFYMFGNLPVFIIFAGALALDDVFKGRFPFRYFWYGLFATIVLIATGFIFFFIRMNATVGLSPVSRFLLSVPTLIDIAGTLFLLVLTIVLLKKIHRPSLLVFSLGVLIFAETALPMIPRESAIKPAYFYPENNIIRFLQQYPKPFRVEPLFKADNNEVGPPWPVGIIQYYGLEEPGSYDAMLVNWYSGLIRTMPANEFSNLANVKFIIMTPDTIAQFRGLVLKPLLSYNGYTLYENLSALDRAFMVYDFQTVPQGSSGQDWLNRVRAYGSDLSQTAIIREQDAASATFVPHHGQSASYNVSFEVYHPSLLKMKVNTSKPGLLVISNTYFPGWNVTVDNTRKKLIRTDYAFDGVFLDKGTHTVTLTYEPSSFRIGLIVTITGLISLLLFSILLKI